MEGKFDIEKRSNLEDFELIKEIGKGAYSKVYKARRKYLRLKIKVRRFNLCFEEDKTGKFETKRTSK